MDQATLRTIFSDPDAARQWFSAGTVLDNSSGDEKSVRFDDDDGSPLELGVLIDVKLHPSGIDVPCRVASQCAGDGESEFHPFGPGDEVFVAICNGNERGGAVIIGRGNQKYDKFPRQVAGMDVTKNNVAFKRLRTSYVIESATAITLSVASTGSSFTLDPTGNVWIKDGNLNLLAMTADTIMFGPVDSSGELQAGVQIDPSKKTVTLVADTTALVLDNTDSQFQSAGSLKLSTAGNAALSHATTIEAISNVLISELTIIAAGFTAIGAIPVTGVAAAAVFTAIVAAFAPILAAAAALPLSPAVAAAITAGLSKPAVPGTPGLGAPGLLI